MSVTKSSDKPVVFIGSSTEGLAIAKQLQLGLANIATCAIWDQGVFGLSQTTIESLLEATKKADFAILVLTPDDLGVKRGARRSVPRDNVIFELGLFMGALGRERTFIVHGQERSLALPSDLAGLTTATFSIGESDDLRIGLGPVCTVLEETIRTSLHRGGTGLASPMRELLGSWKCTWLIPGDERSPILDRVLITSITDDAVCARGLNRKFGNYDFCGRVTPSGLLTLIYQSESRRHFPGGVVILKLKVRSMDEMNGSWYEYDADRHIYGGTTAWKRERGRAARRNT